MLRRQTLFAILFLFFFQLLTEFVAAIYAFGLLGTSIPRELVAVLFFFSPVLLLFWRRPIPLRLLLVLFLLSRVVLPFLSTRGRMLVAGPGVAIFLLWLPGWLSRRTDPAATAHILGPALLLSAGGAMLLRAAGGGIDVTTAGGLDVLVWVLAIGVVALSVGGGKSGEDTNEENGRWWQTALLVCGLFAILTLVYFSLGAPHVIGRWVDVPLPLVLGLLTISLPVWALLFVAPVRSVVTPGLLAGISLLLTTALALTLRGQQVAFPTMPAAYPLMPEPAPQWQPLTLSLFLVLAPVLFLDFGLLLKELVSRASGRRGLAAAFCVGSFLMLLLIFAQVFTSVYDYIPAIGPWFRDRFWVVVSFPGLVVTAALLVADRPVARPRARSAWLPPLLALVMGEGSLVAASVQGAGPSPPLPDTLRVLTYNIQQGYDAAGERAYQEQLAVIRRLAPDVIGLQESDTARIATGNDDLVAYYAGELGYHAYYGPSPVIGTFGVALLSRYPLLEPRTFYMYSEGEQTATIAARVETRAGACHLFVTHLGNGGPMVQLEAIVAELEGMEDVVLMGDFNFRPTSDQYVLATTSLVDAWTVAAGRERRADADPARRIDHIFVSPGMEVDAARYLPAVTSDHPLLLATVRCPARR